MKTKTNHWTMAEVEYIQSHCEEMSNVEIAKHLSISRERVKSIMQYYFIKRTKEAVFGIKSRVSIAQVARDRERVKQGLPRLYAMKISKKFLTQYGRA